MKRKPDVRLAYNPGPVNAYGALDEDRTLSERNRVVSPSVRLAIPMDNANNSLAKKTEAALAPTVRLALANSPPERNGTSGLEGESPNVRLAVTNALLTAGDEAAQERYPFNQQHADQGELLRPALLVSFVYLDPFLKNRHKYAYRDWVLDSGAFSAHASGKEIDLMAYIETCKKLLAEDRTLTEVFALDVIGDHKASLRNAEEMWRQGVPAIPCYHVGEPEDVLLSIARDYPKIALGGAVGFRSKRKWAEQCFARVWRKVGPKKIHGFGYGHEDDILALPWHSVDATNWEIGPCKYGRWKSYGQLSVRGSSQNLRGEVEFYLKVEERARLKWQKEMAELESQANNPAVRLAVIGSGRDSNFEKEKLKK